MKTVKDQIKGNAFKFATKHNLSHRTVANLAKCNGDKPMFRYQGEWYWGKKIDVKSDDGVE